jgi:hypothetical protein
VYADWLSERGDPRGEFIALQCAGRPAEPLREWASGLAVQFSRGFGSTVHLRTPGDLDAMPAFAPREFVTRVIVEGMVSERILAASPWLAFVSCLEFRARVGTFGHEQLKALLDSPHLRSLEALAFSRQRIGDAGLSYLCAHPAARRIRRLAIEDDTVSEWGVTTLVATKWFSQLEQLALTGNPLGTEGVRALAEAPRPCRLKRLLLDHVRCGDEGARALVDAPCFPALEQVSIARNRLTVKIERAVAAAFSAPRAS